MGSHTDSVTRLALCLMGSHTDTVTRLAVCSMGSHTDSVTRLAVCLMGSHTDSVTRQAIRLMSSYTDNVASWAVCLMGLQDLSRLMFDEYLHCLLDNLCKRPSPINVLKLRQIASEDGSQAYGCCCCWSLLYSAVLRSRADSLRSHVISTWVNRFL